MLLNISGLTTLPIPPGVATLKLNRGPVNSLNLEFLRDLVNTVEALETEKACRGLIITSVSGCRSYTELYVSCVCMGCVVCVVCVCVVCGVCGVWCVWCVVCVVCGACFCKNNGQYIFVPFMHMDVLSLIHSVRVTKEIHLNRPHPSSNEPILIIKFYKDIL